MLVWYKSWNKYATVLNARFFVRRQCAEEVFSKHWSIFATSTIPEREQSISLQQAMQWAYCLEQWMVSLFYLCGLFQLLNSTGFYLYKLLERQLALSLLLAVCALIMSLIPFMPLIGFFVGFVAFGIAVGSTLSYRVWMVELWAEKSGSLFQFAECVRGFSQIVGSLIASTGVRGKSTNATASISPEERRHNMILLYMLPSALLMTGKDLCGYTWNNHFYNWTILVPILLFASYWTKYRYAKKVAENEICVPPANTNVQPITKQYKVKFLLISSIFAFNIPTIGLYYTFCSVMWADMGSNIDAQRAAYIYSVFRLAETLAALFNTFVFTKIKADIILAYHLLIIICSFIFLYCMREGHINYIFAGTAFLGKQKFLTIWQSFLEFLRLRILGFGHRKLHARLPISQQHGQSDCTVVCSSKHHSHFVIVGVELHTTLTCMDVVANRGMLCFTCRHSFHHTSNLHSLERIEIFSPIKYCSELPVGKSVSNHHKMWCFFEISIYDKIPVIFFPGMFSDCICLITSLSENFLASKTKDPDLGRRWVSSFFQLSLSLDTFCDVDEFCLAPWYFVALIPVESKWLIIATTSTVIETFVKLIRDENDWLESNRLWQMSLCGLLFA